MECIKKSIAEKAGEGMVAMLYDSTAAYYAQSVCLKTSELVARALSTLIIVTLRL